MASRKKKKTRFVLKKEKYSIRFTISPNVCVLKWLCPKRNPCVATIIKLVRKNLFLQQDRYTVFLYDKNLNLLEGNNVCKYYIIKMHKLK